MKSERSVIRKAVHVGKLFATDELYLSPKNGNSKEQDYIIRDMKPCRSILFVIDKKGFARDILYDSPRYPILGVTKDEYCLTERGQEKVIVCSKWSLEKLLEALGYNQMLTHKDIQKIRNTLFDCLGSERLKMFSRVPFEEYRECIQMNRDKSLVEAFLSKSNPNSFNPKEGRILKRKK